MMRNIIWLLIFLPLIINAQKDSLNSIGISWTNGLSFNEIKQKIKKENKYLFIDCYATWCNPCKAMDKKVYSDGGVGTYFNKNFVSLKVQLDTTKQDNAEVKKWYFDAHEIALKYDVSSFPSYLFISPDGELVHKGIGFKRVVDFIELAKNSLDTNKQFYTLLDKFNNGRIEYAIMPYMARTAYYLRDDKTANIIAEKYINNFLFKQPKNVILNQENIEFIKEYTDDSKDRGFKFFYSNSEEINRIMGIKNYSEQVVSKLITQEEIDSKLWDKKSEKPILNNPNWEKVFSTIKRKYNIVYAERTILEAKVRWYTYKKKWPQYCECLISRIEKYGPYGDHSTDWQFNVHAWDLFERCTDKVQLEKALFWSDSSLKMIPKPMSQYLDTYANILYKMGRVKDALEWEEKAATLAPTDKAIQNNFEKMKRGEITWPKD